MSDPTAKPDNNRNALFIPREVMRYTDELVVPVYLDRMSTRMRNSYIRQATTGVLTSWQGGGKLAAVVRKQHGYQWARVTYRSVAFTGERTAEQQAFIEQAADAARVVVHMIDWRSLENKKWVLGRINAFVTGEHNWFSDYTGKYPALFAPFKGMPMPEMPRELVEPESGVLYVRYENLPVKRKTKA